PRRRRGRARRRPSRGPPPGRRPLRSPVRSRSRSSVSGAFFQLSGQCVRLLRISLTPRWTNGLVLITRTVCPYRGNNREESGTIQTTTPGASTQRFSRSATTDEPAPARRNYKRFLTRITIISTLGGLLFGYDTGVISGALLYMRTDLHLTSFWEGFVVSSLL